MAEDRVYIADAKYRGHVQIHGPANRMAVDKAHFMLNKPRDPKAGRLHPLLKKGVDTALRLQVREINCNGWRIVGN